jgi:hypothetical protein
VSALAEYMCSFEQRNLGYALVADAGLTRTFWKAQCEILMLEELVNNPIEVNIVLGGSYLELGLALIGLTTLY